MFYRADSLPGTQSSCQNKALRARGIADDELQSILAKKIANKFQNVRFSGEIVERELGLNPFEGIGEQPLQELIHTFEKRHPITHNWASLIENIWSACVLWSVREEKLWYP